MLCAAGKEMPLGVNRKGSAAHGTTGRQLYPDTPTGIWQQHGTSWVRGRAQAVSHTQRVNVVAVHRAAADQSPMIEFCYAILTAPAMAADCSCLTSLLLFVALSLTSVPSANM